MNTNPYLICLHFNRMIFHGYASLIYVVFLLKSVEGRRVAVYTSIIEFLKLGKKLGKKSFVLS